MYTGMYMYTPSIPICPWCSFPFREHAKMIHVLFTDGDANVILNAIEYWENNTCLRFEPLTASHTSQLGHNTYLSFFKGGGCWSYVGWALSGEQQISIGNGCAYVSPKTQNIMFSKRSQDFQQGGGGKVKKRSEIVKSSCIKMHCCTLDIMGIGVAYVQWLRPIP